MVKKSKKKKNVHKYRIIIVLFILIVIFYFIINNINCVNHNSYIGDELKMNYSNFITDSFESDSSVINTIFASGINVNDYKKILDRKTQIVKADGKYSKFDYDFSYKLHYSDIEKYLYNINNLDIVDLEIIGKSVDNRNIYGVNIGKGNKIILLNANVHAAEVGNTPILIKFISEIVDKYNNGDQDIINKLNNYRLAIIPTINPDGYEIFNFGIESINDKNLWIYQHKNDIDFNYFKFNANGVDISRNFPTQNAGLYYNNYNLINSVSLTKVTSTTSFFGGEHLGSEPETQAFMYYLIKNRENIIAHIDLHSQGRVLYAGKPNLDSKFNDITFKFADKVSNITNYTKFGLEYEEVGEGNDGTITDFSSEIACGFKLSTKTLKLSTDKYIDNFAKLIYNYPVITLETMNQITKDTLVFSDEYYNHGIRELLYSLLDNSFYD